MEAETTKGNPLLGVKQRPWWPFIPISNYMTPILHCEIVIGNQLLDKLRGIINKYIELYSPSKEAIQLSIHVIKQIISDNAKERDEWDLSVNRKICKTLIRTDATYCKRCKVMLASGEMLSNEQESTHKTNQSKLKELTDFCDRFVKNLEKARDRLSAQHLKLKVIRTNKVKGQQSIETSMFKLLKDIGVELSS